jgi:heptosyltransferase I
VKPRSILILRLSALGDVIHTLPAAEAVRRAFPASRIGWVVERPYAELVRLTAPVDEVFVAATKAWRRKPLSRETRDELFGLARAMRAFARDGITIDFQGLLKSASFGPISGARARYGFAPAFLKEKVTRLFYSRTIPIDPAGHVIEWNVGLANGVAGSTAGVPDIRLDSLAADPAGKLTSIVKDGPVVLFPGARNAA